MLSRFSCVRLFEILWTTAHQAPLSMGFSMQEYWSGLPCPPTGDLPDPRIEPSSFMSPALAGGFFTTSATWEALHFNLIIHLRDFQTKSHSEVLGIKDSTYEFEGNTVQPITPSMWCRAHYL